MTSFVRSGDKACPNREARRGFVMLFAIVLVSIIVAIALGVSNVALKEIKFGTSAIATNDAFFAADTGAECVLANDKFTANKFPLAGPAVPITCSGASFTPSFSKTGNSANYSFTLAGLGSTSRACVKVNVFKDNSTPPQKTRRGGQRL